MRVLQAGIDKSGNYWLWQILRLLMAEAGVPQKSWIANDPIYQVSKNWKLSFPGATELDVVTWDTTPAAAYASDSFASQPLRERSYYYCVIPMYRRRLENVAAYVNANTHIWTHAPWHDDLPTEFLSEIDKIVYIVRDPRDVMVSGAHYIDSDYCQREFGIPRIPLEHRFRRLLRNCPEWAVHVAGWIAHAQQANVHVVSYEGLVADLPFQLRRLTDYLALDISDDRLRKVEEQVVFKSMKTTQLGGHVRKGGFGNWRHELPGDVAQEATTMLSPLLDLLGYQNLDGTLSPFLTRGEVSPNILLALERINSLQMRALGRTSSKSASSPAGSVTPTTLPVFR